MFLEIFVFRLVSTTWYAPLYKDKTPKLCSTIHILCKNSHLTRFEHFADRPQPLYDRFTGKLAPSTLLLVNVLTEKDVDHVFAKKKSEETQELHKYYEQCFSLSLLLLFPLLISFTFKRTGNFWISFDYGPDCLCLLRKIAACYLV